MNEYGETVAKFTAYADSVIAELHEQEVKQVEGQLRALGWEKVVRCRDCKYYVKHPDTYDRCVFSEKYARSDGFCSWGERRES